MGIVKPRKDLDTLKNEWAISGGKIVYDGYWQGGHLRIYHVPAGYTAQYFFSLHPKWFISVDLERVSVDILIKYLVEGRAIARDIVKNVG